MSRVHDTAPDVIYLCLGDEEEVLEEDFSWLDEVSWCADPATEHTVKYVKVLPGEELKTRASYNDAWNAALDKVLALIPAASEAESSIPGLVLLLNEEIDSMKRGSE